jgi:NAD-dependent SIR2 family protein deacetylase
MSDYISRELALADFEQCNQENSTWTPQRVKTLLMRIPCADVEPVRPGRWISLTGCSNAGVYCSICHKKVYKEDYAWCNRKNKVRSPYCPNCGSKMDLEDKP